VRDAHNLYLEMLAELGPLGLTLLLVALSSPLVAAARVRHWPYAGPLTGAYVAYLAHATVDWPWEVPAVTIATLAIGCTLMVAARDDRRQSLRRHTRLAGSVGIAVACGLVGVTLMGNRALAHASQALQDGDPASAAQPVISLGEVQLAAGYRDLARTTFRDAIERDAGEWRAWYGLGLASLNEEREEAFAEVQRLNRTIVLPEQKDGP
jgi:hypothetical protein